MFHRDIISWTLLNNLSSKVPMENPIIQILLFFYLIYSFMNIKSYSEFINEAKLHIYHTTFKVYDLMDRKIYKKSQIKK